MRLAGITPLLKKTKHAGELATKMNNAKAHISYKVLSFGDYLTCTEFMKKMSEAKKIYAADNIQVLAVDPSQVVADDIFMQVSLPLAPNAFSLGSPLVPARYMAWQTLPVALPAPKTPEEHPADTSNTHKESKESVVGKDKDKKAK